MTLAVGRLLIAWSLVAYGVGALVGPALHALPGCDHHDSGGSSSNAPEPVSPTHDDCLICNTINAVSIPLAIPAAPFPESIRIAEVATPPLTTLDRPIGLHGPRAPPDKRSASAA
ncbi:hypothetical protein [Tautonia rosea]|uniref:hypothetical protein n=1 Tax=Tautonia rosea TaxID=2728037 RepID=UPI001475E55C|nr:hypothetical protein [Tautonia rosea]